VIDLGIILNSSKDIEIKIGLAEGWEDNIKLVINTNLSRNKFEEGEKISIQNISDELIKIGKGTKLIEAVVKIREKKLELPDWEELVERELENKIINIK
jgi:hypothetical protein